MSDVLIVVDAQDYWANNNPETTQRIKDSIAAFRERGFQILWVYAQENPDENRPFSPLPPMQAGDGDVKELFDGHGRFLYDPAMAPAAGDWVVGKGPNQTDAFTNPHLQEWLRNQNGEVKIAGFMKGFCVHDTAVSSHRAGLPTEVLDDLSADKNDKTDPDGGDIRKSGIQVRHVADMWAGRLPEAPSRQPGLNGEPETIQRPLLEGRPLVNLVIDVQFGNEEGISRKVRQSADIFRERHNIPTIWVTMSDRSLLHPPAEPWRARQPPPVMSRTEAGERGFYGHGPATTEADIRRFAENGGRHLARRDEAVVEKPVFNAFAHRDDLSNPAIRAHWDSQQPNDLDRAFSHGPGLPEYLPEPSHLLVNGGNADVCVFESAIFAARDGHKVTILTDRINSHADPGGNKSPAQYERELRALLDQVLDRPHELAGHETKNVFAAGNIFSPEDKARIRQNLDFRTAAEFQLLMSGPSREGGLGPRGQTAGDFNPRATAQARPSGEPSSVPSPQPARNQTPQSGLNS